MTEEAALLAAILANRAEDTPRLAYADWCDENGQSERAAFIRLQIRLARKASMNRDAVRAKRMLRRFEKEWLPPFLMFARKRVWSRGFVSRLTCSWADWLAHHEAILTRQPVERVKLTTRPTWEEVQGEGHPDDNDPLFIHLMRSPGGAYRELLTWRHIYRRWPRDKFDIEFELLPVVAFGPTITLQHHTMLGLVRVPQELLDDSSNYNYAAALSANELRPR